jgi:hypothetical protein
MSRIEASKVTAFAAIGTPGGISSSKVVAYVVLQPGDASFEAGQGHCHPQILRRR